jgi:hypothetical protein
MQQFFQHERAGKTARKVLEMRVAGVFLAGFSAGICAGNGFFGAASGGFSRRLQEMFHVKHILPGPQKF